MAKISQGAALGLVSTSDYSGKGRDMQLVANKLSALALCGIIRLNCVDPKCTLISTSKEKRN